MKNQQLFGLFSQCVSAHLNIPEIALPRVVILGGGFAGLKLARNIDSRRFQTVLIDENNYHTFQPLLYQVATAGLEPDSIAYPLRKILKNKKHMHIRMTRIESVDLSNQKVNTDIGAIPYDHLVIATGAVTNFFGNENIEKHAIPMKSLTESLDLRSLLLQNFETAIYEKDIEKVDSHMNFVIVGGGPTGVELAGALAELKKHVLPKDYPDLDIRRMQIHLIEAGPELLGPMSDTSSTNARKYLESLGVNVYTETLVEDYDGEVVKTNQKNFKSKSLIWAAGVKGNIPVGVDASSMEKGRISVDEFNVVKGSEHVYAIGDVAIQRTEAFPESLPMLGSVAQQQGAYLAKSLNRKLKGKPSKPFVYVDKGTMATVGRNKAVVDLGKLRFGGLLAWIAWLFVHLMLLVDFRNRVIVFFNWVWSYVNFDRGTRLIVRKVKREN